MKKVLINIEFKDVYTGKLYKSGEYVNMTDERIAEIKAVNPNFVSVVGLATSEAPKGKSAKKTVKPETTKPEEKKEPETTKPSAEDLIDELEKEEVEE